MADQTVKSAPAPTAGPSFRSLATLRAEAAAIFGVTDSPWTIALLFAAVLNTGLLKIVFAATADQAPTPEVTLLGHAAPYLAILAFWFAGRRWGERSYAPAILAGLCFLPIYTSYYGIGTHGDVLMIPALLIAAHFGAAPQFPTELYAYRRVGRIDALVIFCLLATGAVIVQALAVNPRGGDSFGPIFVAGGSVAPMVVVMLALAVSGADRRLAFVALLCATAASLPGMALPTARSVMPFVSQTIGLSPGGALLCLTALYIDKAVPLLLRWRWEAGLKSIFSLGASIYLSQWVISIDRTAHSGALAVNEFSGWFSPFGAAETLIAQPALPWVIAFAIGVAFSLRRSHKAQPLDQATFRARNGGFSENAGHVITLVALLAIFIAGEFSDVGDWGVLNPYLTFRVETAFIYAGGPAPFENGLVFGMEFLAISLILALLILGYFAARPFAGANGLGLHLAVWRTVRRGGDVPDRPDRPRRILLATVMGSGWVWSGPMIFGLAAAMMVGGELARREIAFDPRSAIRDHMREAPISEQEKDILLSTLSSQVQEGVVDAFWDAGGGVIRLKSPNSGPFIIPEATQITLENLADVLRDIPGPIAVRAFTSNKPPKSLWYRTNETLSEATAQRVAGYLASRMRDPTRVSAEGRGDTEPIVDNSGPSAVLNNRIEIVLIGPATSDKDTQLLDDFVRDYETCGALAVSEQSTRAGRRISGALGSEEELQQLKDAVADFGERADFGDLQILPSRTCDVRADLSAKWLQTAGPLCRATVDDRYPFDREAEADASLQDFTALFAPVGALDIFFVSNLADMVDQAANPWQWREGVDLGYPDTMLMQFQYAAELRDSYFAGGQLSWAFDAAPEAMDPNLTRSVLNIGDQQIAYEHGPVQTAIMEWPSGEGASLNFSPQFAGNESSLSVVESSLSRTGDWAWFRLLDAAELREAKASGTSRAIFDIGDRRMIYQVRSGSALNPISSAQALSFRCPTEL